MSLRFGMRTALLCATQITFRTLHLYVGFAHILFLEQYIIPFKILVNHVMISNAYDLLATTISLGPASICLLFRIASQKVMISLYCP